MKIWGEESWYSVLVRLWIFSITLTLQKRIRTGYSSAATVLLKNITGRDRDGAPEAQLRFDWQLHRENVSQHLKQRNSNKTFRIYQHISLLLFMRKLAFGNTWRSHQSSMIFTRIPWTSFACEEQSFFLFYGLISIKPCCWLGTICTVFENQYTMHPTVLGMN